MFLNINTDATVVFTNQLEKLHKSALPIAIRGALNRAAFNVKQVTMPLTADEAFEKRQPNFFKANSRVEMATGFDVNKMQSRIGFTSHTLKKGQNNFAVKELEEQEEGGTIGHRSFIPFAAARTGGNPLKLIRPVNRLSAINSIIDSQDVKGKGSPKSKFIKAAIQTAFRAQGGAVIGNTIKNNRRILWRIDSVSILNGRPIIKKTAIYSFRQGRGVGIKRTAFMRKASVMSQKRIEDYYIIEAQKQISKVMTKAIGGGSSGRNTRGSVGRLGRSLFR